MPIAEDVERIDRLVEESGDREHRAWLERWARDMEEAAEAADKELCEDLLDALII
jgi:hypothetical protein